MVKKITKTWLGSGFTIHSESYPPNLYKHTIVFVFCKTTVLYIRWVTGTLNSTLPIGTPAHDYTPFQVKWFWQDRSLADGVTIL